MVHAIVGSDLEPAAHRESVILRMASVEGPRHDLPVEVLARDLPALNSQWMRFVSDVLWRRAESGDKEAELALQRIHKETPGSPSVPQEMQGPVISASGGRFGPRIKASAPEISMGPRKAVSPPPPPATAAPAEEVKKPRIPEEIQVIGFNLSNPPNADGLLKVLQSQPNHLVVVAPAAVARRAEDFIADLKSGAISGAPTTFSPIVLRRASMKGATTSKKLRAELAAGIARLLGDLNSALWIMPE
jgi:hypothetical protein